MVGVQDKSVAPEDASAVVKLAHAINESFNVELKMRMLGTQLGDHVPRLGCLGIGDTPSRPGDGTLIEGSAKAN